MKRLIPLAAVLAALVLTLAGCPAADNPTVTYPAVVAADVTTAGGAFGRSITTSFSTMGNNPTLVTTNTVGNTTTSTFTSSDAKIHLVLTMTVASSTLMNEHIVITVTNLVDSTSGYTISGTMTIDEALTMSGSVTTSATITIATDLNFSGGTGLPVQKLTMNISGTVPYISGNQGTPTFTTGTVTCNGQAFTHSDLGTFI